MQPPLKALAWGLLFCAIGFGGVQAQVPVPLCGDGFVDSGEACDDGNFLEFDGCTNCTVDELFNCVVNPTGTNSICEEVLLDLNVFDGTTLDYTNEYLDLNQPVFLSDPNMTNMTTFQTLNSTWDRVLVVILQAEPQIDDEDVDVFTREAFGAMRTNTDFTGSFIRVPLTGPTDSRLDGLNINASLVVDGVQVIGTQPLGGLIELDDLNIQALLSSVAYIARGPPGFNRRDYCIIAVEGSVSTTACIGLYFIGRNDDPPIVTYTPSGTASFTEGQTDFVPIIDGDLQVTDPDHPTRYFMQSAQARIRGFVEGYAEWLSVTQENPDFNYVFDNATGALNIIGTASTSTYADLLSNLTYLNRMMEPVGSTRVVELTVFDGNFTSNAAIVQVNIINTNDEPSISLAGATPIIRELTVSYTEGDGPVVITPQLVVVDSDPTAMIQRVRVSLGALDGEAERLFLGSATSGTVGLELINATSHTLELSGLALPSVYTAVLRTLTYEHRDALPGNPTTSPPRMIVFLVEDDQNTSNYSNLTLNVIPVNDPPELVATTTVFPYVEDDPAISIGSDIMLSDVDSTITMGTITASDLLNGASDDIFVSVSLLAQYNLTAAPVASDGGETRILTISGEASPAAYEQVLRSLGYQNTLTNNSVSNGIRTFLLTVRDSGGEQAATPVVMFVNVRNRNDGPAVDLGAGEAQTLNLTFEENGRSVPIALSHLLDVMDEEGHEISMMTVELVATNGQLDPSDTIFLHTPLPPPVFQHFLQNPPSRTYISLELTGPASLYISTLQAIFYDNSEVEPTYYNNASTNTTLLNREIVIRTTDNNLGDRTTTEVRVRVQIQLINDNRPRIFINSDPASCSEDCRDLEENQKTLNRRRRDVKTTPTKRRKRMAVDIRDYDNSMAPQVRSVTAGVTLTPQGAPGITNVTVTFDPNTNTPIVELQHRLEELVTFDLPELALAPKRGVWLDRATLLVAFEEGVQWESRTASGRERPIFLIFENSRGSCDWSNPCTSGVCFANSSGCPTTGYHQITITSLPSPSPAPSEDPDLLCEDYFTSRMCAYLVLMMAFVAIGAAVTCWLLRSRKGLAKPQPASCTSKPIAAALPLRQHKTATSPPPAVALDMTPPTKGHVQDLIQMAPPVPRKTAPLTVKPPKDDTLKAAAAEPSRLKVSSPDRGKAVHSSGGRGSSKLPPKKGGPGGKLKKVPPATTDRKSVENTAEELDKRVTVTRYDDTTISLQKDVDSDGYSDCEVETLHASAEGHCTRPNSKKSCDHYVANSNQSVSQREQFNERSNDSSSWQPRPHPQATHTQRPH